jgi:polar amino acid transport system substrate-binding protein
MLKRRDPDSRLEGGGVCLEASVTNGPIMKKVLACLILLSLSVSCAMANEAIPAIAKDLAPSGRLRAAINFGNPVLVQKDPATREPRGVSPDLARELARRLEVPVDFIPFDGAGKVVDAVKADAWDVAFLAIDPTRADSITFTAPYVVIEGTYLVPETSPLRAPEDADKDGVRIAVSTGSAYHLYLKRELKHAQLAEVQGGDPVFDLLVQNRANAAAGIRQALMSFASAHPDFRVMPGRFMAINQAMAAPKGRELGARFLRAFVEEMKASGFVARALAASGQADAAVAPPTPAE